ncbi:MAG: BrnA antitoxin family protein [Xanthomonadaceae bacterium]|nr:BrnA antitoxin family protein [Xanthomonadaceae bacterium]MDP2185306.1 BrnA antitoxin family protein [Xanthomonadales bacterium]MDZ4115844.1 BrnA antitoxin family protein [Xanthomonadaceae bacterium]MDZ4378674.1 BrnA antitoxin family protein [Xanthomonadaceae bacterium]
MNKRPKPELIDDENPEWTKDDFARAVPTSALPESLRKKLGVRGPQLSPTKERITIRLSHDVVERFRATGDGWQTRVDTALKDWLKTHRPV